MIDEAAKANKKSAKDNKWGVLPGGPYAGPGDPALVGDFMELEAVAFGATPGGVITAQHVEALKDKDQAKAIRDRARGNPAAWRCLDNLDLAPGTTRTLNLVLGGVAGAGGAGDHFLVPKPKRLI